MTSLPRRDEVVTRILNQQNAALSATLDRLAARLREAKSLPVTIPLADVPETVRPLVEQRLVEAGWRIEKDGDGGIRLS